MTEEEVQILRNDLDGIKIRVRGLLHCRSDVVRAAALTVSENARVL